MTSSRSPRRSSTRRPGRAALPGTGRLWLEPGLLLCGFGVSFALPALVGAIISAAPEGTAGAVGGLLNAVRQTGATLGVTAMGAFVTAQTANGTSGALLLSALVCAAAALLFARGARRSRPAARGADRDRA
ncbi:hypothetical protein [Spirillospora sp. NBC_01491]|uniref:hypothetical protein n=1 Tax=Spirillospora sp. NBC_01491 TaxID=2976007 RepID=UPI002E30BE88|nr:hypothetical protein [Spirillospora sp. NBC_01491]